MGHRGRVQALCHATRACKRNHTSRSHGAEQRRRSSTLSGDAVNGYVPYAYSDTEEERLRAAAEITTNPYPITQSGLARGKELYTIYCGICHGDKADGAGYLVRDDGGVYPNQPANLLLPQFVEASEGFMYHSIMYGKNVMGSYADKLSYEERWQVIHYIRSLQAEEAGLVYEAGASLAPGRAGNIAEEGNENVDTDADGDESEEHH